MNQTKKQPFILNLFRSIKDFDYYKDVSNEKNSKTILYFIILIIMYSLIVTIGIVYEVNKTVKEVKETINTEINSLEYADGILKINNDEYTSIFNNYVIIDTSKENNDEYEEKSGVVIGKQYCSIKMDEHILKFSYNNYLSENINKNDLINILDNNTTQYYILISAMIFIMSLIALACSTIIDTLVISLIGVIIARIIGNNYLKFSNIFKIAVHAVTLPILLSMIYYIINIVSGFSIKYFSIMYTSIATIYIVTAILLITMDSYKNNENNNKEI